MSRAQVEYSASQINKAGKIISDPELSTYEQFEQAIDLMNDWRSAHTIPLEGVLNDVRRIAGGVDPKVLIAERLKRLPSIVNKLQRNPQMALARMQDIAGCRAIVRDIGDVDVFWQASDAWRRSFKPEDIKAANYIATPKPDGYRSLHFVVRYRSTSEETAPYDGMRVEVQIRSALQHAWATAVEMASTYTNQDLKAGKGDEEWTRFFALMGSGIALQEGRPLVPGTPEDPDKLVRELRSLADDLKVETVMQRWSEVTKIRDRQPEFSRKATVFLVTLRARESRWHLKLRPFEARQMEQASEEYLEAEKENVNKRDVQVALVSVQSIDTLRQAYPNYFMDTSEFIRALQRVLRGWRMNQPPLVSGVVRHS